MGSKILLADDSITIQKVVNLTFADEGIEVISVSNGDMAERRLREVDPDLVLADIFMPGKNGYELCEAIKQMPQFRDLPVVLLVGAFEPFNEAEARRVNADAHLTKPFESRVLVETVKQLIDKSLKPKSLSSAAPGESSDTAPQPSMQNPRIFPMPAIDLSAMSAPYPPQESVFADRIPTGSLADPTPFADSFPANFAHQDAPANAPQVDLSSGVNQAFTNDSQTIAQAADNQVAAVADNSSTNLGDIFNVDMFTAPLPVEVQEQPNNYSANLFSDPKGSQNPANPAANDVLMADPVGQDVSKSGGVMIDFETVDPLEEPAADALSAFELVAGNAGNNQINSPNVIEARNYRTNELDPPDDFAGASSNSEFVNASLNGAANNHSPMNNVAGYYSDANAEQSASSLLSADEPLGDLLFAEFGENAFQPQAAGAAPLEFEEPAALAADLSGQASTEPDPTPPVETQGLNQETSELTNEETAQVGILPSPATDVTVTLSHSQPEIAFTTQETVLEVEGAAANPAPNSDDQANPSFDLLMPEKVTPISMETSSAPGSEFHFYTEVEQEDAPEALESAAAEELAQDEVQSFAEPEPEASIETAPQENFTASDMWEAETQFTPVSIAPVPFADYPTASMPDAVDANLFEPASDSSRQGAEDWSAAPQADSSPLTGTSKIDGDMKPEMIDEIVRRVVAQLSDSVVREIAWEVVPDCVERVVSNLTREDLGKRM